jgi:DegV family protein with EDD domain
MRSGGELPTTSQPTPATLIETYERALEEGEEVVAVMAGSTLSGTFQAAEAAAARIDGSRVHLCDSLAASLLQGLMVLKAAELAELGEDPTHIVAELRRVRAQSGLLFTVATLDRLLASGRVSRGTAFVGRLLDLKPILGLRPDGSVVRFGAALGVDRAREALLRVLREQIPEDVEKVRFGVLQVGVSEIVAEVEEKLRAEYGEHVEILSAPVTPVIATHLGIGTLGVVFLVED